MKENQRVRLTKQMLRSSLIELLEDKSINKISIRELCENAQINRTTFYKYYGSQYDLLFDMETIFFEQLEHYLKNEDNLGLVNIINYVNRNLDLCRILFNNNVDPDFTDKILYHPLIQKHVSELAADKKSKSFTEYHHIFVVHGSYSVLQNWLNKPNRESPEEISKHIQSLLNKVLAL